MKDKFFSSTYSTKYSTIASHTTKSGVTYQYCTLTGFMIDPFTKLPVKFKIPKALDFNSLSPESQSSLIHQLSEVKYLITQPKIDGIRCFIFNFKAYSAQGKLIPNKRLQAFVKDFPELNGFDGELVDSSGSFRKTQSVVMSINADISSLKFKVFDFQNHKLDFLDRWNIANKQFKSAVSKFPPLINFMELVETTVLCQEKESIPYTNTIHYNSNEPKYLQLTHLLKGIKEYHNSIQSEGFILRSNVRYEFGRGTVTIPFMIKFKIVSDAEAIVLSINRGRVNNNLPETQPDGSQLRSSLKDNYEDSDLAGSLYCEGLDGTPFEGRFFNVSLGSLTEDERRSVLEDETKYLYKTITFKYFGFGDYDLPRSPIFKALRLD